MQVFRDEALRKAQGDISEKKQMTQKAHRMLPPHCAMTPSSPLTEHDVGERNTKPAVQKPHRLFYHDNHVL